MKKIYLHSPIIFMVAILFYFLFSQCYTTFQHPTVYVPVDSTSYYAQEVTFADDCSQCHEDQKKYVENETDIYADPIYEQNSDWNYYYMTPWWYDPYYYSGDSRTAVGDDQLAPTQRRDFDRRQKAPGPNYATPASSSPALSKSRSSGSSNNSSPSKRRERRHSVSTPAKKSQPAAPAPKRVSRTKEKKKEKK
ncbi:MAG: hypothetical protein GXO74_00105 [Calditrichaeota bacterium]|nr:hypothetical protein [Calditrichota bacterium]